MNLHILVGLHFGGGLEGFRNTWNYCVMALQEPPSDVLLLALLKPQLRKCNALKLVFALIDGTLAGSELRIYKCLRNAAYQEVSRKQRELVWDGLMKTPNSSPGASAPKAGAPKDAVRLHRPRAPT